MNLRLLGYAFVLMLASCAYVDATTTQYVGVPRFPPSDPKTVQILRGEPMQPHDRLGEILLDISVEPAPDVSEVEQRLKQEAASWGANAVLVVRDQVMPGVGRKLIGVALRYR
ncbi:MAG TPA: hypothetical protein VKE95_06680 [Burkholderiales bacterium]|nr:hypothetical protein [Burkholderiales bacterium]